jgi:hypothetical protein
VIKTLTGFTNDRARRISPDEAGAIETAEFLINKNDDGDYLVVKIIRRVRKKVAVEISDPPPLPPPPSLFEYPSYRTRRSYEAKYEQSFKMWAPQAQQRVEFYRATGHREWPQW